MLAHGPQPPRILAATAALPLLGGAAEPDYDVPYVPTPPALVEKMLDLAEVTAADYLIDLGCGDGRIALAAARRGARALGVDIDPMRIQEAVDCRALRRHGKPRPLPPPGPVPDADLRGERDCALSAAADQPALRPRLLTELRPGSRVVSHAFHMGDWRPEARTSWTAAASSSGSCPPSPAAAGRSPRRTARTWALEIEQRFQEVTGTLTGAGGVLRRSSRRRLRGTRLSFTAGGRAWAGTVGDAAIAGENARLEREAVDLTSSGNARRDGPG